MSKPQQLSQAGPSQVPKLGPRTNTNIIHTATPAQAEQALPQAQAIVGKDEQRAWGFFRVLNNRPCVTATYKENTDNFNPTVNLKYSQTKMIYVNPGDSLSLQSHSKRIEHWIVIQGTALITVGQKQQKYTANSHVYIPVGTKHRLENQTSEPVVIIEVQLGPNLDENDIIRYEDKYGRV